MSYRGYPGLGRQKPPTTELARWKMNETGNSVTTVTNYGTATSSNLTLSTVLRDATPTRINRGLIFEGGFEFGAAVNQVCSGASGQGVLEPSGSHTITFWAQLTSAASTSGDYFVMKRYKDATWTSPFTGGMGFYAISSSSINTIHCFIGYNSSSGLDIGSRISTAVGQLVFVAGRATFVSSSITLDLFINGSNYATNTANAVTNINYGSAGVGFGSWCIGGNLSPGGGATQCLNGFIEDVSIWNSALTDENIRDIYAQGVGLK